MTPQIIFSIISVVVLLSATQLVKKFANEFYTKISKFIPIIIGVISIIAQGVFNFASAGSINGVEVISFIDKIDFEKAVQFGALIAASEVGTYEGFFKLVKSLVDKFCFKKDAAIEAKA